MNNCVNLGILRINLLRTLLLVYIFTFPFMYFTDLKLKLLTLIFLVYIIYLLKFGKFSKYYLQITSIFLLIITISMLVNIIYIYSVFNYDLFSVLYRGYTQYFRVILNIFEIYLGFIALKYIEKNKFIKIIFFSGVLILVAAIYQNIAYSLNLPIWGLYISNNILAIDPFWGYRNNSLCGEPKHLAAFASFFLFYIIELIKYNIITKIFGYLLIIIDIYIFIHTYSLNGLFSLIIAIFVYLYLNHRKIFYFIIVLLPILYLSFIENYDLFITRHKEIFEALKNGYFEISMLDDLVYLTLLAWKNFASLLFIGFGPGLLHFYAYQFLDLAIWFKGIGYIDSNVSFFSIVSNYGIFIVLIVFVWFFISLEKNLKVFGKNTDSVILKSITYSFIISLFIENNYTTMLYLSIGIMLSYNYFRLKYK